MSTQCDNCLSNLTWKYDAKSEYLCTKWSTQAFCLSVAATKYHNVIVDILGEGINPPKVPIFNLCPKCWGNQSAKWCEGGAAVYKAIPAKTAADGVYFNNERAEFHDGDLPSLDVIQATLVHEMMHFCSSDHNGLQAFESGKSTHWDECCTDYLARNVFFELGAATYRTFYGNLSDFIKYANTKLFDADWTTFSNKKRLALIQAMPDPFQTAANNLLNKKFKTEYKEQLEKAMARLFITWHQKGEGAPAAPVQGAGTTYTIDTFLATPIAEVGFTAFNDTNAKYGTPMSFRKAG